jgi:hypothetical protein
MNRADYLADVKLCLELLARFEIYPDLPELELFLQHEAHSALLKHCAERVKTAWELNLGGQSCLVPETSVAQLPLEHDAQADTLLEIEEAQELAIPNPDVLEILTDSAEAAEEDILNLAPQSAEKPPLRFKLSNAMVGKAYSGQLEWTGDKNISVLKIEGLEQLGLSFDFSTHIVSGEPEQAGEYRLTVNYQNLETSPQALQTAELNFVINSDPKSLWKNIASDNNVPFWKPDSECLGLTGLKQWKLAAASKRGRSHAHVGSCRDDDFALCVDKESSWQLIAVADGAGSSEFSREGAKIVAHQSLEILKTQLQQTADRLEPLIEHWQLDKDWRMRPLCSRF